MTRWRIVNWWIARKPGSVYWLLVVSGILACLAGAVNGQPRLGLWGMRALTVLAMIFFWHEHLYRFHHYLKNYESSQRVPLRRMKQVNGVLSLIYQAALLAVIRYGLFLPWKKAGDILGTGILTLLRWIGRLIPHKEGQLLEETEGTFGEMFMPPFQAGEASPFVKFLDRLFSALCFLLALVFLAWLIVQGIRRLAAYLSRFSLDEDEAVFLRPESFREKIKKGSGEENRLFGRRRRPFGLSPEMRIRKIYKTHIQEGVSKRKNPGSTGRFYRSLGCLTPLQLEEAAGIGEDNPDNRQFHDLYEKARYSREGCGKEEEEQMKICSRVLSKE